MTTGFGVNEVVDESMVAPPLARQRSTIQKHVSVNNLENHTFPLPEFAKARLDNNKKRIPHIIAHRGYKAKFPENSMLALCEAVKAGATALETDVHLTKDDVLVLSHDVSLKRFGHQKQILDCTWDEIKHMETLAEPHVSMPRLSDLLHYLRQPEAGKIWLLLDIKAHNQADKVMRIVASTIADTPSSGTPWNQRILLGLWAGRYLPLAVKWLPGFPAVFTGFHLSHSRRNLGPDNVGSSMLVQSLLAPGGRRFLRDCQARSGTNIAWTVNDRDKAHWCARRGLDGVITDDPASLARIYELYDQQDPEPLMPISVWGYFDVFVMFMLANCMFWYFRRIMKLDDINRRRAQK